MLQYGTSEDITVSEKSQSQKKKQYMVLYIHSP